MKIKTTKLILLILISTTLFACKGQMNPKTQVIEIGPAQLGKKVTELYYQIWAIHQDAQGNYWFGSNGRGVFYYNGNNLRQIRTEDGLLSDTIRGIQEDEEGNIYIETPLGVSKFDGHSFSTLEIIRSPKNEWKLEANDLWFNCNGEANHVYRYDGQQLYELQLPKKEIKKTLGIDESIIAYSPYTVFGINKDKDGHLWLGTVLAGAFQFDGNSFLWIGENELSRLPDGREPGVRSMIQDTEGYMWLSNFYSKYETRDDQEKGYTKHKAVDLSNHLESDKILYFNSGLADREGNLWMTTYGGGVWKYDGKTLSNMEISNGHEDVLLIRIYQDKQGIIWIGTNNDGVYHLVGDVFKKFEPKV